MLVYTNVKNPKTGVHTAESAIGEARRTPWNSWKCDDWHSEADRIMSARMIEVARLGDHAQITAQPRRGFWRVEMEF